MGLLGHGLQLCLHTHLLPGQGFSFLLRRANFALQSWWRRKIKKYFWYFFSDLLVSWTFIESVLYKRRCSVVPSAWFEFLIMHHGNETIFFFLLPMYRCLKINKYFITQLWFGVWSQHIQLCCYQSLISVHTVEEASQKDMSSWCTAHKC